MRINKRKKEVLRLRKIRKWGLLSISERDAVNRQIKAHTAIISKHQQDQQNQNLWKITTLG